MRRGRTTLIIVMLCFVCLLALNPQTTSRLCSFDGIKRVQTLIRYLPDMKLQGSRVYTPPHQTWFMNCSSSILLCFAAEMRVLRKECGNVSIKCGNFNSLGSLLEELAEGFSKTGSGCLPCELHQEQSAGKFLDETLSTLELINTQNCPPKL